MTKTMKKILSVCLVVLMCMTAAPLDGFVGLDLGFGTKASALDASGSLGENINYTFDSTTGALAITGSGDMSDCSQYASPFWNNRDIKSVTIDENITSIGNYLFNETTLLESVTLPTTIKKIGKGAFMYTYSLKSINLPEGLETIGESAFENCVKIESVTIPKSVKNIGDGAFTCCKELTGFTVDADNENYTCVDGVLFNKTKTELICYPQGKIGESYAIPAGVETIAKNAFNNNWNIKSVTMTNDVKTIGESAFSYCIYLTSVTLSNKLTTIGKSAFFGCSFENIVIPEGVTKIGDYAFAACSNLKTVVLPSTLTEIKQGAFSNDNALSDVYYAGTEEAWNSISIDSNNAPLINANIIFNHTHSVSNYVVVKNGTCENGGTKNGMCVCGMCVETETISTAHTFGSVQHKDADCLNTGYDYKQCTDCKKYFASDAAANATNGKDDTSSFVIPATGHSDGEDGNNNLCDKCHAYIGDITLTVGTNITVPITYAYDSRDTLVKFVTDKTAQYIISSNADSDDQNTYPTMTVYSLTNGTLKYVDYAAGGIGENFNLSTATFIEGQVYCIAFRNYKENAEAYTVNVALGCEHPSTKQTCIGYYCEVCGLYYGSRDSSKHELDTVQTCSGYKCKHCNRYFGDAAPDNHIWDTDGMCTACYTWHDHKTFDENGMCTVCKYALPYVLISGTTKTYYGAFTDALTAAKDGDTIKMQNDDASSYSSVEITKAITLDLNGHFLTQPSSASFAVKANVTFTDSVGGSYCEYGIVLYTSCTFSGGGYRYIAISTDFETEDNLGDYLAACCDYYNYSFGFYDGVGVGTVGSLLDLSSRKNTYNLENGIMIKANHSTVTVSAQEATCTKAGHTAGEYCENCDYTTVTKAGESTGHTFGAAQHKDADCTSGGYDYKQCSSCKKYFAPDAATNATNGKSDYSSFTTQKLNHSYTGDIKNDGDGKNGTHSFKCVNGCGQYGNATAHEWNNGKITTPATHLKEGVKTFECTCGATYTEPVSKLEGHTYTPTVVPPTCTEQGYVEHKCACGDSYKDTYVDAAGHNYENGSCTECSDKDPNYTGDQGGNTGDNTSDCDCICHSSNKFVQFFYKIIRWFWKLFKIHKTCDCGAIHY